MASEFHLYLGDRDLGCFRLQVPGAHNTLNATAAIAVALELDVPVEVIREALGEFRGVDRRFQVRGSERGITIIDDYGHHPTEIRATLAAARACRFQSVHVLFQPHRYTRTQALMDDFARGFHQADSVYVTDIYAASEELIPGVTSQALVERLQAFGHRGANYTGSLEQSISAVMAAAQPGDAIVTLGAGSVSQAAGEILKRLRSKT
jgi:UDP-N-acetylmuramate--alanine ligase